MQKVNYAPDKHATHHVGQQRPFHNMSFLEFEAVHGPQEAVALVFVSKDNAMNDIKEMRFTKKLTAGATTGTRQELAAYKESITYAVTSGKEIILLFGKWNGEKFVNMDSFLNNVLPIPKAQRFQDGIVGIGCMRWLKVLILAVVSAKTADRPTILDWFCRCATFISTLVHHPKASTWFDVLRETLQSSTSIEDVLVGKLAEAFLGVRISKLQRLRWLELSLQRTLKRVSSLADNMVLPVVWLFVHFVVDIDMPVKDAVERAFDTLTTLDTFDDVSLTRLLLQHVLPEAEGHANDLLVAARQRQVFALDKEELAFSDGTVLPPRKPGTMVQTLRADLTVVSADSHSLMLRPHDYNLYTPIWAPLPAVDEDVEYRELTVRGMPVALDVVSKHGRGFVARTFSSDKITSGKAFVGHRGLTLMGGEGDGKSAPTLLLPTPPILTTPTLPKSDEMIATARFYPDSSYTLQSPTWTEALRFPPAFDRASSANPVGALFVKGFSSLTIEVCDHKKPVKPPQSNTNPSLSGILKLGKSMATASSTTPLERLQAKATGRFMS